MSWLLRETETPSGAEPPLLKEVLDRIRWAQQQGYASTVIPFDGKSPADAQSLTSFCRSSSTQYSFVAKTVPTKHKNHLLLVVHMLQPFAIFSMVNGWDGLP